jgi:hypothetical protein
MPLKITPKIMRFGLLALVALLSTTAISFAASGGGTTSAPAAAPAPAATPVIRVPDVTGKAFVFAKGMLEDAGFAWKVTGSVGGYPANVVATQTPPAGVRVVDTGAPTIQVTLTPNSAYGQDGVPENTSPYAGSKVVLPGQKPDKPKPVVRPKPISKPATPKPATPKPATPKPATPKPATPKPATPKPATPKPATPKPAKPTTAKPSARPPAFVVPGAPKEPLDEITLSARAKALEAWVAKHPQKTDANVQHWFYQHEWVVTGAKFGWFGGSDALKTLIHVDDQVISSWGIGSRSRAAAARALREVEAKQG